MMPTMDHTIQSRVRWFHLTSGRVVIGLLAVEGLLRLSERFQWPAWHKGYAVLAAVASVGLTMLLMLLWLVLAIALRRRFQFSIRSLLVLTVAVALPCSWLAVEKGAANQQRLVADEINKAGGFVRYDYEFAGPRAVQIFTGELTMGGLSPWYLHACSTSGNFIPNARPPVAPRLLMLLGDDFFSHVVDVDFSETPVTDAELERVTRGFPRLQCLRFTSAAQVTDEGLEHLKGLTQLLELDLSCTQISDAGLQRLAELTQLRWLHLQRTKITSAGLEHLQALGRLEWLGLDETQVKDNGMAHLAGLTQPPMVGTPADPGRRRRAGTSQSAGPTGVIGTRRYPGHGRRVGTCRQRPHPAPKSEPSARPRHNRRTGTPERIDPAT